MNDELKLAIDHWPFVSSLLSKPQTEDDYDALVGALDELLEITGAHEDHPLIGLLDILSDWIEAYDHEHRPMPVASGVDVLSGKRQLNVRQIRWLAERFGVSVETFI